MKVVEVNTKRGLEKLVLSLGTVIKETETEIFVVFQDGVRRFLKDEYVSYTQ